MTDAPARDILFVGGGLANTLIAWRLTTMRPNVSWEMLEAGPGFGGLAARTWSFITDQRLNWLEDLATHAWPGYDVTFPTGARRFDHGYASIRSDDMNQKTGPTFGPRLHLGAEVSSVKPGLVRLTDGREMRASLVVDGRGFGHDVPYACGFQKFVGLNLALYEPHGVTRPCLMDAAVDQTDGYRFFYVLPWSATELLVEDTYYADTPGLDRGPVKAAILQYALSRGWRVKTVSGEESGVLPIPFAGAGAPTFIPGVALSGVRAGRYHAATGYSAADAARFADRISGCERFNAATADELNSESRRFWRDGEFFRRLNNMLFRAAGPADRWRVMERFFRRDPRLIRRFFEGELTPLDRVRLLSGKPPSSVSRGLKAFLERIDDERGRLA